MVVFAVHVVVKYNDDGDNEKIIDADDADDAYDDNEGETE